jgi:hypothetical protein
MQLDKIYSFLITILLISSCAVSNVNQEIQEDTEKSGDVQSSEEGEEKDNSFDRIEYHFQDASVPPQYHRSYSYILTSSTFRYVVDSYGDIISDTTVSIPDGKWEKVQGMFSKAISYKKQKESQPGCTGGHGESITTWREGVRIFQGSNYYCGGNTEGNLGGDIDGFVETLIQGINGGVLLPR